MTSRKGKQIFNCFLFTSKCLLVYFKICDFFTNILNLTTVIVVHVKLSTASQLLSIIGFLKDLAKMPRPRSARSDTSDADMEGLQEQELVKLQRQYRLMEGDRAAYTEESQNIIRKQK